MHEDLLGYLLGALEPHEVRRVEEWLREDPQAQAELAKLERALRPLEEGLGAAELPPNDLVDRTMQSLPPMHAAVEPSISDNSGGSEPKNPVFDSESAASRGELMPMRPGFDEANHLNWTWMDWAAGAMAAAVLLGLLLPAIAEGRFEARKAACQDQLRQFGTALTQYVMRNQQSRLPALSDSGPEAFAGIYAIRLHDAGLMETPEIRWCPSVDPSESSEFSVGPPAVELVTAEQLHQMPIDPLRQVQRFAGGDYSYTLGVIDQNHFRSPKYESRSSFAVMSDAPQVGMPGLTIRADQIGHGGRGINVLYEDGRVQFVTLSALDSIPDHPLLNHRGRVEAGVNVDDAALAPSYRPPFIDVRQR